MAFNVDHLALRTNGGIVTNGIPGMVGYYTNDDNISAVLTNGYFPPDYMPGTAGIGDLIYIKATDGDILKSFDSNFYLIDPFQISIPGLSVSTITTSNATLQSEYVYLINNSSSGTYTLPTAVGISGKRVIVKKTSSNILITVTIDGAGSETIDGNVNLVLSVLNSSAKLISTGTNWITI